MLQEFREFIIKGNAMDLAIGVIIGAAFSKITGSLVNDILMPPLGLLLGDVNFGKLYINLSRTHYANLTEAQAAGAATINYGMFVDTIIEFLIISFVLFLMVRYTNRLRKPAEVNLKGCPFCCRSIAKQALRCPECTSALK